MDLLFLLLEKAHKIALKSCIINKKSSSSSWTHLGRFDESLSDFAVSSSVAGGDEVGHAAALQEGGGGHFAFAKQLGEGHHFHQTQPDHSRFGVVAETEAVAESSTYGHDILGGFELKELYKFNAFNAGHE